MRFRSSVFLPAAALVLAACGGGGDSSNNNPTGPSNPSNPTTPTATNAVTVRDNAFTPSSIQIAVNTAVTWTWSSGASTHNVTMSDGTGSGDKNAGDTFTKTFTTTGTFNYHCTIHPSMTGSILVQ